MRFNQGDRVKPTAEALRLRVWTATRLGFRPCDRRGTILRCWQDKVEVKWDLPIGSLKRNGVMVAKRFLELSTADCDCDDDRMTVEQYDEGSDDFMQ